MQNIGNQQDFRCR